MHKILATIIPFFAPFFKGLQENLPRLKRKILESIAFFPKMLYTESMKRYKFLFSKLLYAVFALAIVLCCAGVGTAIWRYVMGYIEDTYVWIGFCVLLFVSAFLAVLIVSIMIRSYYSIDDKELCLRLGLLKSRYPLKTVSSVHLFKGSGKLVVYFKDNRYSAIVIAESEYDDFVKTLLEKNDRIGFSFSSPEEEDEIKKTK